MIFNRENIIFNLRVIDLETDELVFSDYYGSIEEINRYLENPSIKEPPCPEIMIDICPIKKDIEITQLFSYELSLLSPLDDEEIQDFYDALNEWSKPIVADITPEIEEPQSCDALEERCEKQALSTYKYLCPYCWNEAENCTCSSFPYFLVQIDVGMVDIVKTLNSKGYFTTATCEGHPENKVPHFYINFKEAYGFDLPEGFYWEDNNIRCEYTGDTLEALVQDKKDKIQLFTKTIYSLPSLINREGI